MILKYLSAIWAASAPALGNHLWQSTLFAIAAGLLTLILRKSHARARYGLWLAASVKFLIPFAVLVSLGSSFCRKFRMFFDLTAFANASRVWGSVRA